MLMAICPCDLPTNKNEQQGKANGLSQLYSIEFYQKKERYHNEIPNVDTSSFNIVWLTVQVFANNTNLTFLYITVIEGFQKVSAIT